MTTVDTALSPASKPLRLWPGVAAVTLQWLARFGLPLFDPDQAGTALLAGAAGTLMVLLWWLFFSRARWSERLGALVLMVAALVVVRPLLHPSIAGAGMGFLYYLYAMPFLCLGLVIWAAASRRLVGGARWATLAAALLAAAGLWTLLRTDGISGSSGSDFAWRWTPTAEEKLLAQAVAQAKSSAAIEALSGAQWPGFRGPRRDGVVPGTRIAIDWSQSPPKELWRRPVGPGWSSFAVAGDVFFTHEQRGEDEVVSCYKLATGEPVWSHKDAARFWESNAGAGPRGTPTFDNGRVYSHGATGIVNALDARDGSVLWTRNASTDTGSKLPDWAFASSPLVVGELVVVASAGHLVAYDRASGEPRWYGPKTGWGYSSPHLASLDGVEQIVFLNGEGVLGLAPADGTVLWSHGWKGDGIVQPALATEGDVLLGSGSGMGGEAGVRRLAVKRGAGGWTTEDRWTSNGLKPYFSDFVVHQGYAYGFDGGILASIDLADGQRKWKGGRFGHGQLVLLPEQDLLLVLSEKGELALVAAKPDQFTELARKPAISGKTWNHPVLVGDLLLVRNDQEMAAFRLAR